jgi:hypothetical protein
MSKRGKVAFFSIATNGYLDYLIDLQESAERNFSFASSVDWFVMTDDPDAILLKSKSFSRIQVKTFRVASMTWPLPTLLRYEMMLKLSELFEYEYVAYIDADMKIVAEFSESLLNEITDSELISAVNHPGFYRPRGVGLIKFYFFNPIKFFKDLKTRLVSGGLGSWERDRESTAYVPRHKRKLYLCGGFWLGPSHLIAEMCETLSKQINTDIEKGVTAIWHDESHLNHYFSSHSFKLLNPSYCFDPNYKNLSLLQPIIYAVNKNSDSAWVRV